MLRLNDGVKRFNEIARDLRFEDIAGRSQEQFFLAATAQSLKRLVRFLNGPTTTLVPTIV
jgi:hypothetical protein